MARVLPGGRSGPVWPLELALDLSRSEGHLPHQADWCEDFLGDEGRMSFSEVMEIPERIHPHPTLFS